MQFFQFFSTTKTCPTYCKYKPTFLYAKQNYYYSLQRFLVARSPLDNLTNSALISSPTKVFKFVDLKNFTTARALGNCTFKSEKMKDFREYLQKSI